MHAYDRIYLEVARRNLARMLDYAVLDLGYSITEFFTLFISSGLAERFGEGDFTLLAGMSGVELAWNVLLAVGLPVPEVKPIYTVYRSEEYWTGWALAYYQWDTCLSFHEINRYVPIAEVQSLYHPFHEMDIRQFVDRMNELYREAKKDTNLKIRRISAGLTPERLSELSGISVDTIQNYESRQLNINHAKAEDVFVLSKILSCRMRDLLEPTHILQ